MRTHEKYFFIYLFISGKTQVVDNKVQKIYAPSIDAKPLTGPSNHSPSSYMFH